MEGDVRDGVFWFEAKTTPAPKGLANCSIRRKALGLDTEHSFLVMPVVDQHGATTMRKTFKITVVDISSLEQTLHEVLCPGWSPPPAPTPPSTVPAPAP